MRESGSSLVRERPCVRLSPANGYTHAIWYVVTEWGPVSGACFLSMKRIYRPGLPVYRASSPYLNHEEHTRKTNCSHEAGVGRR